MTDERGIFDTLLEEGSFLGHVGGLEWRRTEGGVVTRAALRRIHTNPNGTAHGGYLMTLLDMTLGLAALSVVAGVGHPATVSLTATLIGAAREGELLEGEARVESSTRTLTFASGRLQVGNRTVATATAVFRNPREAPATR